ncbi:MAG: LacI family transcriptional regulator [Armatimonadota bacterium]|nr:MAG: LacI family transcriptional regulator [Armatimonadota bacterium]
MSRRASHKLVSPSVVVIANTLRERVLAGEYKDNGWLPTERHLAQEFGVSRTIVRRAIEELERQGLVVRSPRCRPVVRRNAAGSPSTEARRVTFGLWLWPNATFPGASAILRGIYKTLDANHYRLIVESPVDTDWRAVVQSEAQFLERITRDKDVAGVILWYLGGEANLPALQNVRSAGIPLVFLDRRPPEGFPADYVGVDNRHAAMQLVQHLISKGHRHIAHITNVDNASTVYERLQGYRDALLEAGIPFHPELVLTDTGEPEADYHDVYETLAVRLLELPGPPTAVFCVHDVLALRLVDALRAKGVRVPEDIAVAGFDGLERWLPGSPFLTTANQPFERIGEWAARLLLQRIEQGNKGAYQHILLEAPISIHASTRHARREAEYLFHSRREKP